MSSALLTPLTQRTNIITIVLVTVLFAFFRLAGGGFSVQNATDPKPDAAKGSVKSTKTSPKVAAPEGEDELLRSLNGELGPVRVLPNDAGAPEDRAAQGNEPDLMDEILGREVLPASERAKRERAQRQQNSEGLEDVKKMLGLP
jgi:hypothetical protein